MKTPMLGKEAIQKSQDEKLLRRKQRVIAAAVVGMMVVFVSLARAQDVRQAARQAEADRRAAVERARQVDEQIFGDREKLAASVDSLESRQKGLQGEVDALAKKIEQAEILLKDLENEWGSAELEFKELSGNVRVAARELETSLRQSQTTAVHPENLERIKPLLDTGHFPSIDDIATMARVYFDEARRSGEVGLAEGTFVGRDGENQTGRILTLGRFTAIYQIGDEVGFLRHKAEGSKFFALSQLPSRALRRQIGGYLRGETAMVPIDISGGAALGQVTQRQTLYEHLQSGGPIIPPILLVGVVALVIVISRIIYLNRVKRNTGKYMTRVNKLAAEGQWEQCDAIVQRHKGEHSPVNHVIEAGLRARNEDRETLESLLQEAILREMPRVERGLSMLAVCGVVAPLLGLLGTVTGMIETFNVITLYGTGDPKLMSSGISEALVTTEVGLVIAIPIMLLHTFLSRRSNHIIGEMEEKAVSLVNIVEKQRAERRRTENGIAA